MEAQVHQTRILVWVVLALVLAIGLGFLLVTVKLGLLRVRALVEYTEMILAGGVLIALVYGVVFYLVASTIFGLRQFRTSREVDAQVFREAIAERAKIRDQHPSP